MHRRSCQGFQTKIIEKNIFILTFNIVRITYYIHKSLVILSQEIIFLCFDQTVILQLIAPLPSVTPQLQNRDQRKVLNSGIVLIWFHLCYCKGPL